jgi:hypothetical protein
METGNITVTLTESQHELICDMLMQSVEAFQFVSPYDSGMYNLPLDSPIVQRYTMVENLREMFQFLWADRFERSPATFQ